MSDKRVKAWAVLAQDGEIISVCMTEENARELTAPCWTGERVVRVTIIVEDE